MSWRRILVLAAVLLLALAGATWFVLQRTGAATGLVRSVLERLVRAEFELGEATIDLISGQVRLDSLRVADPARPGTSILDARQVQIGVETDPLGELLAVHEFAVDGLALDIDLTGGAAPSLDSLLVPRPSEDVRLRTVVPIRVERSRLRLKLDVIPALLEFSDVQLALLHSRADDGTPDPQRGVLRGNAQFDNLGIRVQLQGEIDLTTELCRVQARILDLALDAPFLRLLQPLLRFELPTESASAHLHELTLWLEVPLHESGEVLAGASFELDDVHCTMPELPAPLRGALLRGVATTRDGGTAQVTAERLWSGADSGVVTEVAARLTNLAREPHFEIRGTGRSVPLDATLSRALQSFDAGRAIVEGLRPTTGTADFELDLRDSGGDVHVAMDLELHDVSLAYHGFGPPELRAAFPLPIVHANGHVHLRDQIISIEDVEAQVAPEAGGGTVTMSGRVDQSGPGPSLVSVDLFAPSVRFTPALRAAFAVLVRDDGGLYDQFGPEGAAAVRLRIRPWNEPDGDWQVTVEPLGADARWTGFPLPMRDVRGQIVARAQGLQVDLTALYADCKAAMKGRLLAPPGHPGAMASGAIDLLIRGEGVPLDEQVRAASTTLAPQVAPVWEELAPTGRSNAVLGVRRAGAGAEIVWDLELEVTEGRCLLRSFPMPVTGLRGEVFVHGRDQAVDVQIDAMRGRLQEKDGRGAELAIVGTVATHPQYTEDLAAVIRNLDLDAELGATLERTQAIGAGTWSVLRPSGSVDVICRQQRAGDAAPQRRYTVLLRDARSDAELLPRPATGISGELEVIGGEMTFRDLRGRMGSTIVDCSQGRVGPAAERGRTEVAFTVSAERLPLDDAFARLFVGPLRQAVLDRQLRGTTNVNGLRLRFLLPSDGGDEPIETVLEGQIEALDVEMLLGTRVQEINGVVALAESHVTRDGGALHGNITKGSLRITGQPLLGIQTDFTADAERFVLRNLSFGLHGGKCNGRDPAADALVYELARGDAAAGKLAFDLEFQGVNLREFLRACGMTNAPYHGTAVGWARLDELRGYDFVDMAGEGELTILDGDLGTVPMFTSIYALMAEQNRPRFEQLSVHCRVADRTLHLDDLNLRSPLIAVDGGGTMSMEGYLDVVLTTDTLLGGSADMLLLPPVIQMITSSLVRFHLFGHLRDLRAEQRWFAQRDPRRRRLLPVPPRIDRPRRADF